MSRFGVILPAAGRSSRFGGADKKVFLTLGDLPVWFHAAAPFLERDDVARVVVSVAPEDRLEFLLRFADLLRDRPIEVVAGGQERADSIERALAVLGPECEYVAVHDAARPCLPRAVVAATFEAAREVGAAVPALAVRDTLKRGEAGRIVATVTRESLYHAQTPQVFRADWLRDAYARRDPEANPTDDAMLVEAIGLPIALVAGSPWNLKITAAEDLAVAAAVLASLTTPNQIGEPEAVFGVGFQSGSGALKAGAGPTTSPGSAPSPRTSGDTPPG